jgi:hypothetical protein
MCPTERQPILFQQRTMGQLTAEHYHTRWHALRHSAIWYVMCHD